MNKYSIIETDVTNCNTPEHKKNILKLWQENLACSSRANERFDWLYKENPCGPAKTWLAVDNYNNEIIGCASLYPKQIYVKGRVLKIGIAVDFVLSKQYRVFGPALKMQKTLVAMRHQAGFEFIFGFPNKSSSGVFTHAGYKSIGQISHFAKILNVDYKINEHIKISVIANLISIFLNFVLYLLDLKFLIEKPVNLISEELAVPDDRFDVLWNKVKANYNITGEKTSVYLKWRYARCPLLSYRFFCLCEKKNNELLGYLVYGITDNMATIYESCYLHDNNTFHYLMLEFLKRMRRGKAHSIILPYLGGGSLKDRLKKFNFINRNNKRNFMVFIDEDNFPQIQKEFLDQNNWSLFDGEVDL